VFFRYSAEDARIIEERRRPELELGLPMQIGLLRMNGKLLDAEAVNALAAWGPFFGRAFTCATAS
jgi:hypothetical protein